MRAIHFGGAGMRGQGMMRELLQRPSVTQVLFAGCSPFSRRHPKLAELIRADLVMTSPHRFVRTLAVRRPTVSFVVSCGGLPAIHRASTRFALKFLR